MLRRHADIATEGRTFPRDPSFDSTLSLLREGYLFLSNRRARFGDVFSCRLMLEKAICIGGPGAARLFYDGSRFRRSGVVPRRVRRTLLGDGGVHGLDGEAHRRRKAMFMALMTPAQIDCFGRLVEYVWRRRAERWDDGPVSLLAEAQRVLFEAICRWAGVPIGSDFPIRLQDCVAMIDGFGAVGPRHWRARLGRFRSENWMSDVVYSVRDGSFASEPDTALHAIVWNRDSDGRLLDERTAAVEMLNIVRPILAAANLVAFAAVALYWNPDARKGLNAATTLPFVEEVRRLYPFTPLLGARTTTSFVWEDYTFPSESLVVLDVYGINHDNRLWDSPDAFRPDRFKDVPNGPFDSIPQGGGNPHVTHRCAGEGLTLEALKASVGFLAGGLAYDVPPQDLTYDLGRVPSRPRSGFVIARPRLRA